MQFQIILIAVIGLALYYKLEKDMSATRDQMDAAIKAFIDFTASVAETLAALQAKQDAPGPVEDFQSEIDEINVALDAAKAAIAPIQPPAPPAA